MLGIFRPEPAPGLNQWPEVITIDVLRQANAAPHEWPFFGPEQGRALIAWYDAHPPKRLPDSAPEPAWCDPQHPKIGGA
jgi:hypothetical protein